MRGGVRTTVLLGFSESPDVVRDVADRLGADPAARDALLGGLSLRLTEKRRSEAAAGAREARRVASPSREAPAARGGPPVGRPRAQDAPTAVDPVLRIGRLLPGRPNPVVDDSTVRLPSADQIALGLELARAGRFDLLARVLAADGEPLRPQARPAFEEAVRDGTADALHAAAARERRGRDVLFRAYAADADPDPAQRWMAVDWAAVRRAAAADGRLLAEAATVLGHPECPSDVRLLAATAWRTRDVWGLLLGDRAHGRELLREADAGADVPITDVLPCADRGGVDVADVLELAHPAGIVLLDAAGMLRPGGEPRRGITMGEVASGGTARMRMRRGVAEAAAARLRDDVDAWTVACRLCDGFPGSVAELLATADAATSRA